MFTTYLTGGLLIVLGPGELLRAAAEGANTRGFHLASVLIETLVMALAILLWVRRRRWSRLSLPAWALRPESSLRSGQR